MRNADWFSRLTGFEETSAEEVRSKLRLDGTQLCSLANGAAYEAGRLEVALLKSLDARLVQIAGSNAQAKRNGKLKIAETVADVQSLHANRENAGAVFQVASQFNLLEMISPEVTPEQGVGIYENDPTQGPACAIACGAGTIIRNYFVPLANQLGQTRTVQLDCLDEFGKTLGNANGSLWRMKNGYALPSRSGLTTAVSRIESMSPLQLDNLFSSLKVGIQWNTQVTLADSTHTVTQVYGSAMPVAYSGLPREAWAPLAQMVLVASYQATFAVAVIQSLLGGSNKLFLTLLGAGAFGNEQDWILNAIRNAVAKFSCFELDVKIVSYGKSNPAVRELCDAESL